MNFIDLNLRQYLEFEKIALGVFQPVTGFMNKADFDSVVSSMRLDNGKPFPLPVVLDVSKEIADRVEHESTLDLFFDGVHVGSMRPDSVFTCDKRAVAARLFGIDDMQHPGASLFTRMNSHFLGGPVVLLRRIESEYSKHELSPSQTKKIFADRGWKKIVGFQTRNVPHRAHEYLQRIALESADGLFVQPLIGRKRKGDYTPAAIIKGYQSLLENFFPPKRVLLGTLSTYMRYAGPREAVFHAIIRRNFGCTHFIVGRDHAGVGNYYGKYDSQNLAAEFESELGIEILRLRGPYYCSACDGIVTEKSCRHEGDPSLTIDVSGTLIRSMLRAHTIPDPRIMRAEVVAALNGLDLFIRDDDV